MKTLYLFSLIIVLSSCNQNQTTEQDKKEDNQTVTEQIPSANTPDKYFGYWKANDGSEEILKIFLNGNTVYISDGSREEPMTFDDQNDKLTSHQTESDIELVYSKEPKQIIWKVIHFGDTEGKVRRTYDFMKK